MGLCPLSLVHNFSILTSSPRGLDRIALTKREAAEQVPQAYFVMKKIRSLEKIVQRAFREGKKTYPAGFFWTGLNLKADASDNAKVMKLELSTKRSDTANKRTGYNLKADVSDNAKVMKREPPTKRSDTANKRTGHSSKADVSDKAKVKREPLDQKRTTRMRA